MNAITRHKYIFLEDAPKSIDSPEIPISTVSAGEQLSSKLNGTNKIISSVSRTSSERKKDLGLAKMRREEVDRQCDAAICLQQVTNRLDLEEMKDINRQKAGVARCNRRSKEAKCNRSKNV